MLGDSANGDGVHGINGTGASGVSGFNGSKGYGVYATAATTGTDYGAGIWAESFGTSHFPSGAGSDGVDGVTHSVNGTGVVGINTTTGVGVAGLSAGGFAFQSYGDATQSRGNGGWIKAMAYLTPIGGGMSITRCYNSQMTGAAVSTPPCGITIISHSPGSTVLDLGFQIQDRFYNFSCSSWNCAIGGDVLSNSNPTQLLVQNYDLITRQLADTAITVFVY